jgi:hypothetical protein
MLKGQNNDISEAIEALYHLILHVTALPNNSHLH